MADDAIESKMVLVEVQSNGIIRTPMSESEGGGLIIGRLNGAVEYDQLEEKQAPQWDLADLILYAATVMEPLFDEDDDSRCFHSLGQEIAFAALCAAAGNPLTDRQQDLIDNHTRDGKVKP